MNKVLVADDNPENIYLLKSMLDEKEYVTITAMNGAEALKLAHNSRPDIIISDVLMPVMDGFMLCREWKKDENLRKVPFIFYTATYTDPKDEEFALSLGADRYIHMPVEPDEFQRIIGSILEEVKERKIKPMEPPPNPETIILKEYNEVLVRKLEDKKNEADNAYRNLQKYAAELETEIEMRRKAEEELNKTMRELQRSNKELEQFAYAASHDLQEPLRMVSNFAKLLSTRYKGKLDSTAEEYLHFLTEGAKKMHMLINDLLAFSRVNTRGAPFEDTDLSPILESVLKDLQYVIEDNKAAITKEKLPVIFADPMQMELLLQNLISNALKFRGNESPQIQIKSENRGGEWVFSIKDNGIGIDPKFHERIFVIFQRLHEWEQYPGTGLGLALCKKIIERHGGRIWIDSEKGKGSTFYFSIPVKPPAVGKT